MALLIPPQAAIAATATANFNVTATVGTACTISVPLDLSFGAYDPVAAAPLDSVTTMNVTCTLGTATSIDISQGGHATGTSTADAPDRRLSDGGTQYLSYALYQDAGRSVVWGGGASALVSAGTGAAQNFSIYGRIWALQPASPGIFSDPVVATITF